MLEAAGFLQLMRTELVSHPPGHRTRHGRAYEQRQPDGAPEQHADLPDECERDAGAVPRFTRAANVAAAASSTPTRMGRNLNT